MMADNRRSPLEKERLAAVLACMGDGVVSTDLGGRIEYMNVTAEEITGWTAAEAVGRHFDQVFPFLRAGTNERLTSPVTLTLEADTTVGLQNQTVIVAKDGTAKYVSASCAPIKVEDAETVGVVVVFRDITRIKLMEERVRSERNNLQMIIDSAPVGMLLVDQHFCIKHANAAFLSLSGQERADVLNSKIGDMLYCSNSRENGCGQNERCRFCELRSVIRKVFATWKPCNEALIRQPLFIKGTEEERWFKMKLMPIAVAGETHVIVILDDITDMKRKEEKLIETNDYVMSLFESLPILIWRCGTDMAVDYVNKGWFDFTGVSPGEALRTAWFESIHPDDRKTCLHALQEAFDKRQPFENEYRLRRHDGQYRWMLNAGSPYHGVDGRFCGFLGALYDITDRKIAEEALGKYRVLSEKAGDIILFSDSEGQILDANEAAIAAYGYSREELLGLTVFHLRKPDELTRQQLQQALEEGIVFESEHIRKDGSSFPVEVNAKGTAIGNKKVLLSIIRDVTERKRAEQELKQTKEAAELANKAKSEFLANMSHEIRTPINGMLGMIDLTLLTELSEEQRENLRTAKTCANSLLRLINDILDFSRLEAKKLALDYISFSLRELVEETVKALLPGAAAKGLDLHYSLSAVIPAYVTGDPNRLQQVLNNLLHNAIKFTEAGEVALSVRQVSAAQEETTVKFSVSDTGVGISADEQGRLFKTFSQVDGSITRKYGGTGLGLAISQQLVNMMGGRIEVESEKGKGSCFHFTLTFHQGKAPASFVSNREAAVRKAERPLHILLAEDEPINQMMLTRMLKEKGHHVTVAGNGIEALELLERMERVDVVFMDIQMPEMDGLEAARRIREREAPGKHTPIVALTAHALQGDRERFLALGMDGYIPKPVRMEALYEFLDKLSEPEVCITEGGKVMVRSPLVFRSPLFDQAGGQALLESLDRLMQELKEAAARRVLPALEASAHAVKDACRELDAEELKSAAFRIELAARRGNVREALEYSLQLEREWERFYQARGNRHADLDCGR